MRDSAVIINVMSDVKLGARLMTKRFKKPRCLECDEELKYDKKGYFTNPQKTQVIAVYTCEDCDQAYVVDNGELKIAPYDSQMNPIKEVCTTCGITERFRQKCVYILNDDMIYEPYCIDCGIEFLRNWSRAGKGKPEKITKDNVQEIANLYDMDKTNRVMADPEQMKKIMEKEPYKSLAKELRDKHGNQGNKTP